MRALIFAAILALTAPAPWTTTIDGDSWSRPAPTRAVSWNAAAMDGWTPTSFRSPLPSSPAGVLPVKFTPDPAIAGAFLACTEPASIALRAQGKNPNDCTTYAIYAMPGQTKVMAPYAFRQRWVNGQPVGDYIAVWRIPLDRVEWTSYIKGCPQP